MEEFFRAMRFGIWRSRSSEDWAVDIKSLAKIGEAAGQTVLGPPLAPDESMPARYLTRP